MDLNKQIIDPLWLHVNVKPLRLKDFYEEKPMTEETLKKYETQGAAYSELTKHIRTLQHDLGAAHREMAHQVSSFLYGNAGLPLNYTKKEALELIRSLASAVQVAEHSGNGNFNWKTGVATPYQNGFGPTFVTVRVQG